MPIADKNMLNAQWTAATDKPKRSVFGNYRADESHSGWPVSDAHHSSAGSGITAPLQSTIDLAVARSFLYRFLAKAFEDPAPQTWQWLADFQTAASLCASAAVVSPPLAQSAGELVGALNSGNFEAFHPAYVAAFGHAARGSCPLNEIEYGDLKADPLFQPHRLADLAAFYRAFGLEVAPDADERHDHICLEFEFLCVLAAKEAYALENQLDPEELALCRDAQKKFLREHPGRWTSAFARRLAAATNDAVLRALAGFTRALVEAECARFGVAPGSEDLFLRPVDEAAESMCASCGLANLPPGALAATDVA